MILGIPVAVAFGLAAASVTTAGLIIVVSNRVLASALERGAAAFASGALVCIVVLHLMPEAMRATPNAPYLMLAGLTGGFVFNRGVLSATRANGSIAQGVTPALAIGLHSFLDGLTYAVSFTIDLATGMLTVLGLILHEVPEGIIVYGLLRTSGMGVRAAFALTFLTAAATTPLGAIAGVSVLEGADVETLGSLYAVVAGLLMYVSVGHLLPHVEKDTTIASLLFLVFGGAVASSAVLLQHSPHYPFHDHRHHQDTDRPDFRPVPRGSFEQADRR